MIFTSSVLRPTLARSVRLNRLLSTLTIIEHSGGVLAPSNLNTLSAAKQLGGPITALVAGSQASKVASEVAKFDGVEKVLVANNEAYDRGLAENFSDLVTENITKGGFSHVLVSGSAFGKNVLPRVSAALDVQPINDITKIEAEDTFVRPIYAGNALATVKSTDPIKLITIRSSAFEVGSTGAGAAAIEDAADPKSAPLSEWISENLAKSERPDLGSASKVVSGGRGLKDKENFDKLIFPLADSIGAAVGASRAAVDSGFADNSLQVGQTGKVVAPDLYVAVGISGAIQHLAGMKDSKTIVAINKDSEAPIFQVADFGLVDDLFSAVPKLTEQFQK
ncbi:hypothetical protein D0Z00_001354 [Geotrichum galactomycetum]|uniref:Uncharacterized protein n=1 Tax=Geotrichum galactomycetum TaxID=27317 RepID=A0ACB6V7E3_9ASCO|nr:hypothetical protein D0Z00_001354 [Geotrichum candidum]